jgi:cell wall-associated NlpC family hydrolase
MKKIILTFSLIIVSVFSSFTTTIDPITGKINGFVKKWWNVPYVYGGNSKRGIDCSALTQRFYSEVFNTTIPRTASSQYKAATKVSEEELQVGDLVFFSSKISPSGWHVGVYIGDDQFIHAANRKDDIKISCLSDSVYKKLFKGAGRI